MVYHTLCYCVLVCFLCQKLLYHFGLGAHWCFFLVQHLHCRKGEVCHFYHRYTKSFPYLVALHHNLVLFSWDWDNAHSNEVFIWQYFFGMTGHQIYVNKICATKPCLFQSFFGTITTIKLSKAYVYRYLGNTFKWFKGII